VIAGLLCSAACGTPAWHAQAINSYRAYGEYHPASQDADVVAKAASADPSARPIRIFQEALPEGIEMQGPTFGVAAGYSHRLLGKYAFASGKEEPKDDLVVKVKKMCVATGANAAIVVFLMTPNDHQDRAQGIEAILVDLHDGRSSKQDAAINKPSAQ
jgi:hypothetical protein